jgi:ABC-type multidrug transport system fused ATPase/permease subunit
MMSAQQEQRPISRATLRRIAGFARPRRKQMALYLLLSVVMATLAVATPVLAGRVVDAIVDGESERVVIGLALLIALIAITEAGLGLFNRWLSSNIGEGLILDLRTAVFDHVQRMPIAFFMRTRTGALVSRLNSDVMGAQRAFSDTLSGVVSNLVMLALTLVVMLRISWQITLLALVLLPVFVLPARRMGSRLAALRRESANYNAEMSAQMTERFSAPGATLVKLYGRPAEESDEFARRARRVRDIGVRSTMLTGVFITALTTVSALALALVYGLGGFYALRGELDAGAVVSMALLLTRLYSPLTSLANARVEIMGALVSFERVFEVLDLEPLIQEKPDTFDSAELDEVYERSFTLKSGREVIAAAVGAIAIVDRELAHIMFTRLFTEEGKSCQKTVINSLLYSLTSNPEFALQFGPRIIEVSLQQHLPGLLDSYLVTLKSTPRRHSALLLSHLNSWFTDAITQQQNAKTLGELLALLKITAEADPDLSFRLSQRIPIVDKGIAGGLAALYDNVSEHSDDPELLGSVLQAVARVSTYSQVRIGNALGRTLPRLGQKIGSRPVIEMVMSVYKNIKSEQSLRVLFKAALEIPGWGPKENAALLADKDLSGAIRSILSTRTRR